MHPSVSIIIPTYNRRELLQDAVASCLAQTYPNIEVMIIDDGSTDGTQEVVEKLIKAEWFGKVVYFYKANGGASSAKNMGMRLARGDFIQFLDSDDVLRQDKISRQIAAIQSAREPVDCCLCFGRLGCLSAGWALAYRIGELCPDISALIRRQCERTVHVIHTEAPLWSREFLNANADWREDLSVAEEWEYYTRLLTSFPHFLFVPEDLFWVRVHNGEQLSKAASTEQHVVSSFRAIREIERLLSAKALLRSELARGLLDRACAVYINHLCKSNPVAIAEFERWFSDLAGKTGNYWLRALVTLRRFIGRRRFLHLYIGTRAVRNFSLAKRI